MNKDIEILKNKPSIDELNDILQRNYKNPSFVYINTLLDYNVIDFYPNLEIFIRSFQSLIGLGNLLNKLKLKSKLKSNLNEHIDVYLKLIELVINNDLLSNLLRDANDIQIREIEKLLFKGRLLSIINEVSIDYQIDNNHLLSTSNYIQYLIEQIKVNNRFDFLFSLFKFSNDATIQIFKSIFNKNDWIKFIDQFNKLKKFEKKDMLKKLFIYLGLIIITHSNIVLYYNILEPFQDYLDEIIIEHIILIKNDNLSVLTAMLIKNKEKLIQYLFSKWADENIIKSEPISIQESRTYILTKLIYYAKDTPYIQNVSRDSIFINSISSRLGSFSNNIKDLAIILADYICEINKTEKIFKIDKDRYAKYFEAPPQPTVILNPWENLTNEITEVRVEQQIEQQRISKGKDLNLLVDEPTTKVANPIYIRDLLEYLTIDNSNKHAFEIIKIALEKGPLLLLKKSSQGTEVEFYSEDLLTCIIGMDNSFNIENFESLKLKFMIAIIISNYKVTKFLFTLLADADYSISQRMLILSATSLSARELRGIKDEIISNSFTDFPTKKLPDKLHNLYLELQNDLMESKSIEAQDRLIPQGKLLRMSQKLKKRETIDRPKIKNFFEIIGTFFYFPLINVFYSNSRIRSMGHYQSLFLAHYLKTLSLLLHCAYPSSNQLTDMIKEYLILVIQIIKNIKIEEVQVIESIITGILLILDISDNVLNFNFNFNEELIFITNWLLSIYELIIDDKVKSLTAGLLIRLTELQKKYETSSNGLLFN
ncbi:unnamed protein product [Candida verbasci]|uniref:Telomere length regulation protein conserved domain-containing protein n=1 Tax=Candida verbasci TaxID=1227364 RepID=A0A9W4U1S3_9ASCO|nr:unnamed protein product [Candida verbasci]